MASVSSGCGVSAFVIVWRSVFSTRQRIKKPPVRLVIRRTSGQTLGTCQMTIWGSTARASRIAASRWWQNSFFVGSFWVNSCRKQASEASVQRAQAGTLNQCCPRAALQAAAAAARVPPANKRMLFPRGLTAVCGIGEWFMEILFYVRRNQKAVLSEQGKACGNVCLRGRTFFLDGCRCFQKPVGNVATP